MRHLAPKDRGSSADQTNINLKPVETVPGAAPSTAAKVAPEVSFSIVNIAGMERGGEGGRGGELVGCGGCPPVPSSSCQWERNAALWQEREEEKKIANLLIYVIPPSPSELLGAGLTHRSH